MVTEMVGCRLTPEYIAKIDALVDNGDFTSRGEFLKYAIRQTLKRYEGRSPPPSDLNEKSGPRALMKFPKTRRGMEANQPAQIDHCVRTSI